MAVTQMVQWLEVGDNVGMDPNRLREATRPEHEATEAVMPLMQAGLTRALYGRVLCALYPVVESWERWASGAAPPEVCALLQERRRAPTLAADLRVLGLACPATAFPLDWGRVAYGEEGAPEDAAGVAAAVMGTFYVMEGSTLGGRFIARYVEEQLGFAPGEGDAYFQGHGEATGGMWREFRQSIAAIPDRWEPEVIAAARRTFVAFGEALQAGLAAADAVS